MKIHPLEGGPDGPSGGRPDGAQRHGTLRWWAQSAEVDLVPPPRVVPRRLPGLPHRSARAARPRTITRRSARLSQLLGVLSWVTLVISGTLILATQSSGSGRKVSESVALIATGSLFAILSARLISAAVAWPERRIATLVLTVSIVSWGLGSSALTASQPDLLVFPAPGEGFFIASGLLMAVFLALDVVDRGRLSLVRGLEAVVTCGGAVCLAGAVLLSPLHHLLADTGARELLALLYPLLDLLLLIIVIADVALRRRVWNRQTASLLGGFAALATADSTFVRNLSSGVYDFSGMLALIWGLALTLLVAGACGSHAGTLSEAKDGDGPVWAPLAAAATAVTVLVVSPNGAAALYLTVPAVITLVAAGIRLALALRTARGAAEAYRLSLTDELTGLPNRRALLGKLREHAGDEAPLGLLLVDLDGFKEVNDTLGHVAGDSVLRLLAARLRAGTSGGELLARLGGDEFAVVLPDSDGPRALRAAQQLRDVIAEPIEAHDHLFSMNASIGVAISLVDGSPADSSELLRRADIAMYQAKTTRAGQLLYDRARDEFTTDRLKLAEYLRYGIAAGELRVWYQPQVEASDGRVSGLEALVRWQHPDRGLLAPAEFLAVARQSGLMPALTEAVISMLLADIRDWAGRGFTHRVSFNFAPPELLNPTLLKRVLDRIDAAALPADSLVLEVTEDSFLAEPERAKQALVEIRRHQVQVSIDDYGTGFSSLSYLRDLPVHELKLDRSFIKAIGSDQRTRIIVESTTQMARGLGLRTVAEGVEDQTILEQVQAMGIDVIQGYHVARPMPAAHVPEWIARRASPNQMTAAS